MDNQITMFDVYKAVIQDLEMQLGFAEMANRNNISIDRSYGYILLHTAKTMVENIEKREKEQDQ